MPLYVLFGRSLLSSLESIGERQPRHLLFDRHAETEAVSEGDQRIQRHGFTYMFVRWWCSGLLFDGNCAYNPNDTISIKCIYSKCQLLTDRLRGLRADKAQVGTHCLLTQLLQGSPVTAASHLILRARQGTHALLGFPRFPAALFWGEGVS